jgi:hypothetical protein
VRGVLREALLRQGNELGAAVHPIGPQPDLPFVPPLDQALQQVPVGAAYVQKVAMVGDSIEDQFPFHAPPLGATAKARLPDRIRFPQIRLLQRSETSQECNRKVYHAMLVLRFADAESLMHRALCPDKPTLAEL